MKTPKDTPKHQTFLVRAWLEQTDNQAPLWRFRVQNVRTAEWHSFADIASLISYFQGSLTEDAIITNPEDNSTQNNE